MCSDKISREKSLPRMLKEKSLPGFKILKIPRTRRNRQKPKPVTVTMSALPPVTSRASEPSQATPTVVRTMNSDRSRKFSKDNKLSSAQTSSLSEVISKER